MNKVLVWIALFCFTTTSFAQQGISLPHQAAAVKRKVDTLAPDARISVLPLHGREEFGGFVSKDDEGFTFLDVDSKTTVTLKYVEVKKVKDGYGGYNSARGRHTDHAKGTIIVLVVVGVLGGIIAAAAAAK